MKNLRYLKPVFNFILIGLLITTLSRVFLFFIFKERVVENENHVWSRIVWDPHDPHAPDELQLFYNFVYHFIKT